MYRENLGSILKIGRYPIKVSEVLLYFRPYEDWEGLGFSQHEVVRGKIAKFGKDLYYSWLFVFMGNVEIVKIRNDSYCSLKIALHKLHKSRTCTISSVTFWFPSTEMAVMGSTIRPIQVNMSGTISCVHPDKFSFCKCLHLNRKY